MLEKGQKLGEEKEHIRLNKEQRIRHKIILVRFRFGRGDLASLLARWLCGCNLRGENLVVNSQLHHVQIFKRSHLMILTYLYDHVEPLNKKRKEIGIAKP